MTISSGLRREVFERAGFCCEYCRVGNGREPIVFHVDHIISKKHGGRDYAQNLCLACADCNRCKGSNLAGVDRFTDEVSPLFNPRLDAWEDHFAINSDGTLAGRTPEGRATIVVLRVNEASRVEQRANEMLLGNYPCQNNPSS